MDHEHVSPCAQKLWRYVPRSRATDTVGCMSERYLRHRHHRAVSHHTPSCLLAADQFRALSKGSFIIAIGQVRAPLFSLSVAFLIITSVTRSRSLVQVHLALNHLVTIHSRELTKPSTCTAQSSSLCPCLLWAPNVDLEWCSPQPLHDLHA